MGFKILTINPGSTSTKIALFEDEKKLWEKSIEHSAKELRKYGRIFDQYRMRKEEVAKALEETGTRVGELAAISARGGLLRPLESGVYRINKRMLDDLREARFGEHASNLGPPIAYELAGGKIEAFVVDPVSVDEMIDIARLSGIPEIERRSLSHALNCKAVARKVAKLLGRKYEEANFVVAHLGGGITVSAHRRGRMIDVNNANEMGPFSAERAGGVPVGDLLRLAFSGKYSYRSLKRKLVGEGGLVGYLGTNDLREVKRRIAAGDRFAKLVFEAMGYQIACEMLAFATTLKGDVDAFAITGGMAKDTDLVKIITERIGGFAPVFVVPGSLEMEALALGALRVLRGEEKPKEY